MSPKLSQYKNRINSLKKWLISFFCALVIFFISWWQINSSYSFTVEDSLHGKIAVFNYEIANKFNFIKKIKERFCTTLIDTNVIFINTGRDLQLIDDQSTGGNVAVADREKLLTLFKLIAAAKKKPTQILVDLNFDMHYTYNADSVQNNQYTPVASTLAYKKIDAEINDTIGSTKHLSLSVKLNDHSSDKIAYPVYKANSYGIVDYTTYGLRLNKFRLYYNKIKMPSMPLVIFKVNRDTLSENKDSFYGSSLATFYKEYSVSKGHSAYSTYLCFNYIWPTYYYRDLYYYDSPDNRAEPSAVRGYRLGDLITFLKADTNYRDNIFSKKSVLIGNFDDDKHITYNGQIPGTLILWDIYLSLLNGQEKVSFIWFFLVIATFTILSYYAIYAKLPKIGEYKGTNRVLALVRIIIDDITYLFILTSLSVISTLFFNVPLSIIIPAVIFFLIEKSVSFINKQ